MQRWLLVILGTAAAAAGCGGEHREQSPDTTPEQARPAAATPAVDTWDRSAVAGCELVSDAEIRLALGQSVASKEEGKSYGCRWRTESNAVALRVFPDADLLPGSCDEAQEERPYGQSARGQLEPVSGVGDTAIWGSSGDLLVCTGSGLVVVDVEASTLTPEEQKHAAVQIADNALARLASDVS
ncbi:MAG TPA: hypothetical protein VHG33_10260 [Woeseiaceae bacterium]|nr:hypothetical protein [Woeseiaceae bacterium]